MIVKIKETLYNKSELILDILNDLELENIHFTSENEIRWGRKSGNKININTLSYVSYSDDKHGDVISLVSDVLSIDIGKAIKWLAKKLNLSYADIERVEIKPPFGGFWKQFSKTIDNDETPPKTYDISRLDEFNLGVSKLFIEDGISALTQEEFGIGYDRITNRITIPWLNCENELIGIMGRVNKKEVGDKENKYLPLITFRKSKALYGLNVNYKNILEKNCIIVCEGEKAVLQSREYGMNNVVALGGNQIHRIPQKLIKSMHCDVIIALDEGLELNHCIEQAKKVQIVNPFFSNSVYVLDMEGMPSKSCIFDLSYEEIQKAFEERLIYID